MIPSTITDYPNQHQNIAESTNNYSYRISNLIIDPDGYNLDRPKIVRRVMVELTAQNSLGQSVTMNCLFDLVEDPDSEFTAFENLTEDQVKSWIEPQTAQWQRFKQEIDRVLEQKREFRELVAHTAPWVATAIAAQLDLKI